MGVSYILRKEAADFLYLLTKFKSAVICETIFIIGKAEMDPKIL